MRYDDLLGRFVQITRDALGENLTGVYLHGSLAMGCFNPRKSDLDLIVVVRDALSNAAKIDYLAQIVALNDDAFHHYQSLWRCAVRKACGWCDVENAAQDIGENPLYVALNLCRVLAYAREGAVLSKRAGGEWGAANLPEPYRRVAQAALACDTDDTPMQIDEAGITHST